MRCILYIRRYAEGTFETFATERARDLIEIDPNLSLAALRIEMERVLHLAVCQFFVGDII